MTKNRLAIARALVERNEARGEADIVSKERDEARREAAGWQKGYEGALERCTRLVLEVTSLGKQLAALRAVLYELLREHECLLVSIGNNGSRRSVWHNKVYAVLTDTAQAAALYQRVPKGHRVVPPQITDIQREAALLTTGAAGEIDWLDDFYEAAVAAAPTAKPQAGEGTEPKNG